MDFLYIIITAFIYSFTREATQRKKWMGIREWVRVYYILKHFLLYYYSAIIQRAL